MGEGIVGGASCFEPVAKGLGQFHRGEFFSAKTLVQFHGRGEEDIGRWRFFCHAYALNWKAGSVFIGMVKAASSLDAADIRERACSTSSAEGAAG